MFHREQQGNRLGLDLMGSQNVADTRAETHFRSQYLAEQACLARQIDLRGTYEDCGHLPSARQERTSQIWWLGVYMADIAILAVSVTLYCSK